MRGYVYLDVAKNLEVKTEDYIDNEDPGFFQRARHHILLVWKFDSNNEGQMLDLMISFKNRQLPMRTVQDFAGKIGFDLAAFLKKNRQATPTFELPSSDSIARANQASAKSNTNTKD